MTGPGQGGYLPGPTPNEIRWEDLFTEAPPDQAPTEIVRAMNPIEIKMVVAESMAIEAALVGSTAEARFFTEPEPDGGSEPLPDHTMVDEPPEPMPAAVSTGGWRKPAMALLAVMLLGLGIGFTCAALPVIIASMNPLQHLMLMILGVVAAAVVVLGAMIWRRAPTTPTID